jgi:hypothetical protein
MGKFSILEQLAMALIVSVLQVVIKNPASVAKEASILHQVAQLATQADAQVSTGSSWSYSAPPAGEPAPPPAKHS